MEMIFIPRKKLSANNIEKACAGLSLQLTMKGSVKSLPENLHWHYKMGKQPGVLEITLILNENKLILTCKKSRTGDWVNEAVEELKRALGLGTV